MATSNIRPVQLPALGHFINDILLWPWARSFPLAVGITAFGIFTLTFPKYYGVLRWLRLTLAPVAALLWIAATFPSDKDGLYATMFSTSGMIPMFKAWDVLLTGFWDKQDEVPRWVALKFEGKGKEAKLVGKVRLPLPTTVMGRFAYTVDLFCSIRGASFFQGYAFDYAPSVITSYRSGGRLALFYDKLKTFITQFAITAFLERIVARYLFDLTRPNPLTRLPWSTQLYYDLLIGVFIWIGAFLSISPALLILLPLLQLNPDSFAPFQSNPFPTHSLSDFWGSRWHQLCRRNFYRVQLPIEKAAKPYVSGKTLKFIRALGAFAASTLFHLLVPYGRRDQGFHIVFWEPTVIYFFMSQPFGLLIEDTIINPFTETLPGRWKTMVRRIWVWTWVIWTGRWYCGSYLLYGLFHDAPWNNLIEEMMGRERRENWFAEGVVAAYGNYST